MWSEQLGRGGRRASVTLTQAPDRDWPNTQQGSMESHRSSLCLLYLREVSGSNLELRSFKEAMFSILNNQRAILSMQEELQSRHLIEEITGALWERSPTGLRFLSGSNVPVALESRQWHTTTG